MNTTKTTRRTGRLTFKSTRPFVAIKVEHVAATTMIIPCTARKDLEIEGDNGAKIRIKAGDKFYLHRSASLGENMFYIVQVILDVPLCTCMATKPCKHETAIAARIEVSEVEEQPVEVEELAPVLVTAAPAPSPHLGYASNLAMIEQARKERRAQERRENAPLNGNRPFSMMR